MCILSIFQNTIFTLITHSILVHINHVASTLEGQSLLLRLREKGREKRRWKEEEKGRKGRKFRERRQKGGKGRKEGRENGWMERSSIVLVYLDKTRTSRGRKLSCPGELSPKRKK